MDPAAHPKVIRFGVFEVDLRSEELFKNGHRIKLQDQPFQILAALLEHSGEVVTREIIRQKLWPRETFVDFDHSLNTAIRLLRLALGDSAENPRFIETLPRKGYRFICPLENLTEKITNTPVEQSANRSVAEPEVDVRDRELNTQPEKTPGEQKKQRLAWPIAAITLLVVVAGSILWWQGWRRGTGAPEPQLVPVPFTTYPGHQSNASFSADGNQVTFAWNGRKEDNWDIYVKQVGSESLRRLTTDLRPDRRPAWSPDGQSIAFLRVLGPGHVAVMLIPANGGRERQLTELRMANVEVLSRLLSWHPGGKWLAVSCDLDSSTFATAIVLLSLETNEQRRLTTPPKGVRLDTNPAFSPDGRTLAFARHYFGGSSEIYLLRISADLLPEGEPKQLTSMNRDTGYPAWMPDGKEIVFSSGSLVHAARLWRIPISGASPAKPLPFSNEVNGIDPAISMEKHRLVYSVFSLDVNIWRYEVPKEGATPAPPERLLPSTQVQIGPEYSPDGKAIAYLAWTSGDGEIWVCDNDGANPLQLTHLGGPVPNSLRWSPDGQKIVFDLASKGEKDLYLIPSQGGEVKRLTHTSFNERHPSFSRDGKWIYFGSDRNGDFQIWKMPTGGGEAVLVARKGGSTPQESPDGRTLFYTNSEGDEGLELWKVSLVGGEETFVLDDVWYRSFSAKQEGIYFVKREQDGISFLFYDFAHEKTKPIAKVQKGEISGFTVSPDEQWILYTQAAGLRYYLMLVENFR